MILTYRSFNFYRFSGVYLDSWNCETISSALQMPNSVLTELHLLNSTFEEKGVKILAGALIKAQCKLEALRFVKHFHGFVITSLFPHPVHV